VRRFAPHRTGGSRPARRMVGDAPVAGVAVPVLTVRSAGRRGCGRREAEAAERAEESALIFCFTGPSALHAGCDILSRYGPGG